MAKEVRIHLTAAQKSRLGAPKKPQRAAPEQEKAASPEPLEIAGFGGDTSGSAKGRPTIANKLP